MCTSVARRQPPLLSTRPGAVVPDHHVRQCGLQRVLGKLQGHPVEVQWHCWRAVVSPLAWTQRMGLSSSSDLLLKKECNNVVC